MLDGPPRRWHVYVVDLEPRVGTKPGKQRPCLAIQPTEFAEGGLRSTVVLPLTTKIVEADVFHGGVLPAERPGRRAGPVLPTRPHGRTEGPHRPGTGPRSRLA